MMRPFSLLLSLLCVLCLAPSRALGQPAAYPADALFTATTCGSGPSFDPSSDGGSATSERDIVGDSTYPALYVYDDGVYAYFRIRLEDSPLTTAGGNAPLAQFGWGIGVDTDNDTTDVEYNIIANGITEVVSLVRVSDGQVLMTWQPTLDSTVPPPFPAKYVQVIQAADGSSFGGTPDFFLTFAVPMSAAASATATDPSPLTWGTFSVWAATSSNGTTLSGDFMCWDNATGTVSLPAAATGPVTAGGPCTDGQQNGSETDVDCGGGSCPPCVIGQTCATNTDCSSALCDATAKTCVTPCPAAADGTDCDSDGLVNILEDKNGNGVVDTGETDPNEADTDGDGLDDAVEDKNANGVVDAGETNPTLWDTDGGGESDGSEVLVTGHDPLNPADDTVPDGAIPDLGPSPDGPTPDLGPSPDGPAPDLGPSPDGPAPDLGPSPDGPAPDLGPSPDGPTPDQVPTPDSPSIDAGPDAGPPDAGPDQPSSGDSAAEGAPVVDGPPAGDGTSPDSRPDEDDLYLYGSGCGCTLGASGGEAGLIALCGLLVLALALVLARRRRPRGPGKKGLLSLILLVLLGAGSGTGRAETVGFPVVNFQPAPSTLNFYVTADSETLPHLVPSAALYVSYAHRPLQLWSDRNDRTVSEVVRYQVNMDLLVALGFSRWFEIGVALPMTLAQDSEDSAVDYGVIADSVGPGVGDLRLVPKMRLFRYGPVGMAAALPLSLPTGNREDFLGADGMTYTPTVALTVYTPMLDAGLNVGVRIRNQQSVEFSQAQKQVTVNDDLMLSVGLRVPLVRERLYAVADTYLAMAFEEQDKEEIPFELLVGLRYFLPKGFIANIGAGPGLSRGIGTPTARVFAGLGYQYQPSAPPPLPPEDRDGDGLNDEQDACPDQAEDADGFEDEDGCPDPDNDKDGVPDGDDRCPLEPEDVDRFEDQDGCPELDDDKDGIPDGDDRCPLEAEDRDGFKDEDGCPDPDNDGDAIVDRLDKCPLEPETYNKVEDEDGCPDQSAGPVQIARGKINTPPVFFATAKDVILARSEPTLKLLAETLRANSWIKKVRIEGHTDDRGSVAYNIDLSRRRAASVMTFLVSQGIESARLESEGFGPTRPVAPNTTAAGRAKNRRVEFVIVDPPQEKPAEKAQPPEKPQEKPAEKATKKPEKK